MKNAIRKISKGFGEYLRNWKITFVFLLSFLKNSFNLFNENNKKIPRFKMKI